MPIILESPAASGGGGSGTVTNVSSANTGIAVANPTTTPTLTLATLDVIAADGPPAANWSNNSKKITSLANGAAAQDAAAFGQIPTALPPNGAAGGDLTGTYPSPTLAAAGGGAAGPIGDATHSSAVTVDAKGRVTALSSVLIAGTAPGGAAGGDLTGTYPNPTLANAGGGAAGPTGSTSVIPVVTVDAKGRVTALASAAPTLNAIATANATSADVAINSHKLTGVSNAVAASDAFAFGQVLTVLPPSGAQAEAFYRLYAAGSSTITSQTLRLVAVAMASGMTLSSITFVSSSTALVGGSNQLFGIFDDSAGSSSGTAYALLRGSNDDTSTAWAANTAKTLNLTSSYVTTRAGLFYIGILVKAGTAPNLTGLSLGTANLTGLAPILTGNSTTGLSALPNPAIAPTAAGNVPYLYVS